MDIRGHDLVQADRIVVVYTWLQDMKLDADTCRLRILPDQLHRNLVPLVVAVDRVGAFEALLDPLAIPIHEIGPEFGPCVLKLAGVNLCGHTVVAFRLDVDRALLNESARIAA